MKFNQNLIKKFSSHLNPPIKNDLYKHIKSLLFVPGNQEKMLRKSYNISSHVIVPDLEDSVPNQEKANARKIVLEHLDKISVSNDKRLVFPRLNSLSANLFDQDLEEMLNEKSADFINGFVIPKVNTPEEFKYILNKQSG